MADQQLADKATDHGTQNLGPVPARCFVIWTKDATCNTYSQLRVQANACIILFNRYLFNHH